MDKEEKFIEEKFGRETPFRVPEGYFDDFTSRLMKQLPEDTSQTGRLAEVKPAQMVVLSPRKHRWHKVIAVAACLVAGMLSWTVYSLVSRGGHSAETQSVVAHSSDSQTNYSAMDYMFDYTMIDNEDMYAYVAEN